MTLDQLRYFRAVCKHSGVSRAADALNISQPSISNAIANLEKEFGVALFTRNKKRLQLTNEGLKLLNLAEELLLQAEQTAKTMEALGNSNKILRLGVPPMIGSLILPFLFDSYFKKHPQIQVQIFENSSNGLKQLLADDQIDMAFLPHIHPFEDTLNYSLMTVLENVCCVHKDHKLAKQNSISLAQLADEPLILFENSFFQTERIVAEFSRLSVKPNILLHTSQLSTLQNMVASKTAAGFIFKPLIKSTPDLVGISLDPPMTTNISLVWKQSSRINGQMRDFIHFIKNQDEEYSLL